MRTVERLNIDNPRHAGFMYDLGMACKDQFLDDYDNDIIALIDEYDKRIKSGETIAFLASVDGEEAGIIWVEIDRYNIGYVHIGLMPKFRGGPTAYNITKLFITFCFKSLKVRSLESHIPTFNRVTEKLLRRLGFVKYGLKPEATLVNGVPEKHVLLALTRNKYEELNNG